MLLKTDVHAFNNPTLAQVSATAYDLFRWVSALQKEAVAAAQQMDALEDRIAYLERLSLCSIKETPVTPLLVTPFQTRTIEGP